MSLTTQWLWRTRLILDRKLLARWVLFNEGDELGVSMTGYKILVAIAQNNRQDAVLARQSIQCPIEGLESSVHLITECWQSRVCPHTIKCSVLIWPQKLTLLWLLGMAAFLNSCARSLQSTTFQVLAFIASMLFHGWQSFLHQSLPVVSQSLIYQLIEQSFVST